MEKTSQNKSQGSCIGQIFQDISSIQNPVVPIIDHSEPAKKPIWGTGKFHKAQESECFHFCISHFYHFCISHFPGLT